MKLVKVLAAAIVLAVAAFAIHRHAYMPFRCDLVAYDVSRATEILRTSDPTAIAPGTRENLIKLQPCLEAVPWSVTLRDIAAVNYRLREEHEQAKEQYEAALRYDRRPELHLRLGLEYLALGDMDRARPHLLLAAKVRPHEMLAVPLPLQDELLAEANKARGAVR